MIYKSFKIIIFCSLILYIHQKGSKRKITDVEGFETLMDVESLKMNYMKKKKKKDKIWNPP